MAKKYETSIDYRHLADKIWKMARENEALGFFDLAQELKTMSDYMHDQARKKNKEEENIRNPQKPKKSN